jgi:DNA-binding MarR family transcriptional regulator
MHNISPNAHRLLRLFEQMRNKRHSPTFRRLGEMGLSPSHLRAMHMLAPGRTMAMKDLAEQLDLTPPSVTALTRRLVQTGMVHRQAHAEDSRVALLSLTGEGLALLEQLYQDQVERMEQLLGGLTPEEQQLFLDLLERAVRATRDDDRPGA